MEDSDKMDKPVVRSTNCQLGWKDGSCCCNCSNQVPLHKHPWNRGEGKGPASETMGFVCMVELDDVKHATFYEFEHGFCEFHVPTPKRQKEIEVARWGKKFNV